MDFVDNEKPSLYGPQERTSFAITFRAIKVARNRAGSAQSAPSNARSRNPVGPSTGEPNRSRIAQRVVWIQNYSAREGCDASSNSPQHCKRWDADRKHRRMVLSVHSPRRAKRPALIVYCASIGAPNPWFSFEQGHTVQGVRRGRIRGDINGWLGLPETFRVRLPRER